MPGVGRRSIASEWFAGQVNLMAPIVSTIDITRPQKEVFCYVTDPTTFPEWQAGVVRGSMEGGESEPAAVGGTGEDPERDRDRPNAVA